RLHHLEPGVVLDVLNRGAGALIEAVEDHHRCGTLLKQELRRRRADQAGTAADQEPAALDWNCRAHRSHPLRCTVKTTASRRVSALLPNGSRAATASSASVASCRLAVAISLAACSVALAASLPAALPMVAASPSTSRRSSAIWKARPRRAP